MYTQPFAVLPAGTGKEKKEKKAKKRKAEDEEPTVDAAAQDAGTVEEVGPGHVICALNSSFASNQAQNVFSSTVKRTVR